MAKWLIKETNAGDSAHIKFTLGEITIKGYVHDCDGDYVEYTVRDNDTVILYGYLQPTANRGHNACWNEAIRLASNAIASGPVKPEALQRLKQHFEGVHA